MMAARGIRLDVIWRMAWTVTSLTIVQFIVCGLSLVPVAFAWQTIFSVLPPGRMLRLFAVCFGAAPSYVIFALSLMAVSPVATRLLGWRTPADAEMRIADVEWPLLRWVRYEASIHVVRLLAGSLFRGTPLWSAHLRWSGARLGRRVYVNTLSVSDYNLLEFADDVVIGGGVQLSGHTVEGGVVKTARIRLDRNVTIGLGSVVEIGVTIGPDAQVGALSFVPKHATLPGGATYVGAPALPIS